MLQHVDMKPLKEKYDIDDGDELPQITAARTPMKKCKPFVYEMKSNICNEKLGDKTYLEKVH